MQRKNKYTFHIVLLIYLAGQNFFNPLGILSQQMGKLLPEFKQTMQQCRIHC